MGEQGKFLTRVGRRAMSFKQLRNSTACERSSMGEFGRDCCIQGYTVYKELLEKCWSV